MPDICMCVNLYCEVREDCYRYLAIPNEYRQCYADFGKEGNCKDFLSTEGRLTRRMDDADSDNEEIIAQFRGEDHGTGV